MSFLTRAKDRNRADLRTIVTVYTMRKRKKDASRQNEYPQRKQQISLQSAKNTCCMVS